MNSQLHHTVGLLAQESSTDIDIACANQGALCEVLYEWTDRELFAEALSYVFTVPLKLVAIVVLALMLNKLLRRWIGRLTARLGTATVDHGETVVTERTLRRAEERSSTVGSLLRSLSSAIIYSTALIMILEAAGISIIPVIASAGVISLAIGFGAQSVVEDLLTGVFMLAEDQFAVGDRIDVGVVNGYVERVTLRTVVIRDSEGTLWHVPNSKIDRVANENQESSRATVHIGVSYDLDLDRAIAVLQEAANNAAAEPAWQEHVQRPPEVSGVQELADDAVDIRVVVWVSAGQRRKFERHLRRKLKDALDAAGLQDPNEQVDVWLRQEPSAA